MSLYSTHLKKLQLSSCLVIVAVSQRDIDPFQKLTFMTGQEKIGAKRFQICWRVWRRNILLFIFVFAVSFYYFRSRDAEAIVNTTVIASPVVTSYLMKGKTTIGR